MATGQVAGRPRLAAAEVSVSELCSGSSPSVAADSSDCAASVLDPDSVAVSPVVELSPLLPVVVVGDGDEDGDEDGDAGEGDWVADDVGLSSVVVVAVAVAAKKSPKREHRPLYSDTMADIRC